MINKAYLIITKDEGDEELEIGNGESILGRNYEGSTADIRINKNKNDAMSRYHCKIYNDGEKIEIEDTNSTNGTSINGKRIDRGRRFVLNNRDKLSLGDCKLEVKIVEESGVLKL